MPVPGRLSGRLSCSRACRIPAPMTSGTVYLSPRPTSSRVVAEHAIASRSFAAKSRAEDVAGLPKPDEILVDDSFVHRVNSTLRQYQLESLVVFAGSSISGFGGFFAVAWLSGMDFTSLAVGSLLHLVTKRPRMASVILTFRVLPAQRRLRDCH